MAVQERLAGGIRTRYEQYPDGWIFNLSELSQPLQEAQVTIASWLRDDQGWRPEAFNRNIQGLSLEFVFHTDNPPLQRFIIDRAQLPFLNVPNPKFGQSLDLSHVLKEPKPVVKDKDYQPWVLRYLHLDTPRVGPFLPSEEAALSQVPFSVKDVVVLPFRLYANSRPWKPIEALREDPSRVVIHVSLIDMAEALKSDFPFTLGFKWQDRLTALRTRREKLNQETQALESSGVVTREELLARVENLPSPF